MRQFDESPVRNHNGSTQQGPTMPTTLTLKNIPDEVYKRLKVSAEAHRRSLNSEGLIYLENALLPSRVSPSERLARTRALRNSLPKVKLKARDIEAMKREGRQ
jgi:antitoxin FitA